jgi:hypothetical protein
MALMEAPAIIVGLILIHYSVKMMFTAPKWGSLIKHSFTNGGVLLITGSLIMVFLASDQQAWASNFTTDMFKVSSDIFYLTWGKR